jgi:hypothetical protein
MRISNSLLPVIVSTNLAELSREKALCGTPKRPALSAGDGARSYRGCILAASAGMEAICTIIPGLRHAISWAKRRAVYAQAWSFNHPSVTVAKGIEKIKGISGERGSHIPEWYASWMSRGFPSLSMSLGLVGAEKSPGKIATGGGSFGKITIGALLRGSIRR